METTFEKKGACARRSRKSTPKVRSGCITCKARRVKCDEEKPECRRCLRTGRTCEGYPDLGPRLSGRSTAQHLPLEPASITTYSIPFKVPGSQADRQLLHYYCCQAAWDLSSCADPALWTELVLQRANHESVVRNALVALSALHKDYLCGELVGVDYETTEPAPAPRAVSSNLRTMGMISRCHRQLRKYLSRPDASPAVALICSVIFYAFESLLGDSQQAIWHLDQGLILLKKCQRDNKSFDPHDPLVPYLTTLLHQLDLQASCFDDRRCPILRLATVEERRGFVDIVPETFLDLAHAEAVLAKLQNCTLHNLVNYVHSRGSKTEEEEEQQPPSKSFVERLVLAAQLHKYEATLTKFSSCKDFYSGTSAHTRQEDHRQQRTQRIMRLRINLYMFLYLVKEHIPLPMATAYEMGKLATDSLPGYTRRPFASAAAVTATAPSDSDAESDLESAFSGITALLSHADSTTTTTTTTTTTITTDSHTPTSPFSSPPPLPGRTPRPAGPTTYTLSTQLVSSIYFLCLKQTDPRTQQRGMSLFSHPRLRHARDGLWDARTAAFLVENLVKVRQHGSVTQGSTGSDIVMRVSGRDGDGDGDGDGAVDMAKLERVFRISESQGLPMMQSKKFTMCLGAER